MITAACRKLCGVMAFALVLLACSQAAHADLMMANVSEQYFDMSTAGSIHDSNFVLVPDTSWSYVNTKRQFFAYSDFQTPSSSNGDVTAASLLSLNAHFSSDFFYVNGAFAASGGSDPNVGYGNASTAGFATFGLTVNEPVAYMVTGNIAISGFNGTSWATFQLAGLSSNVFAYVLQTPPALGSPPEVGAYSLSLPVSSSGVLTPGSYSFYLAASANASGDNSQASFTNIRFTLAPLPEPATMTMLTLGGLALMRRRRK